MPILRLQDFFFCQNQRNIFLSVNWSWQIIIVVAHLPNDVIDHFEICQILETFYHLFYKLDNTCKDHSFSKKGIVQLFRENKVYHKLFIWHEFGAVNGEKNLSIYMKNFVKWINYLFSILSDSYSKNVAFTKFLSKKWQ